MACNKKRKFPLLYATDELKSEDREDYMIHLRSCTDCRRLVGEYRKLLDAARHLPPAAVEPRWDHVYRRIRDGVHTGSRRRSYPRISRTWLRTAASVAFLLAIGIFIGRMLIPTRAGVHPPHRGGSATQVLIGDYLQDIRPLMIDLANIQPSGDGGTVDDRIVASLLLRTRLLKARITRTHDALLLSLLEEIELILMEIGNRVPGDRHQMEMVQQLIHAKKMPLKIDLYGREQDMTNRI